MAALKADNDIGTARQPVNNLSLALIAPLGADHGYIRHLFILWLHALDMTGQARKNAPKTGAVTVIAQSSSSRKTAGPSQADLSLSLHPNHVQNPRHRLNHYMRRSVDEPARC